jgi:hypothetical protein
VRDPDPGTDSPPAAPPGSPDAPKGISTAGLLAMVLVALVVLWIGSSAATEKDRLSRTTAIVPFEASGPIHLAPDGRIILARNSSTSATPDGRVEAFDLATGARTTLLDGVTAPIAADVAPDGTACAIRAPAPVLGGAAWLGCSSGLRVEIAAGAPAGLRGGPQLDVPALTDIVSDGGTGWFVSDYGRAAILHVDGDGKLAVVATMKQNDYFQRRPKGLSRSDRTLLVGTSDGGYLGLAVSDRDIQSDHSQWITSGLVIAIAFRPGTQVEVGYGLPVALIRDNSDILVTYPVAGDAEHPRLVQGLESAGGLVVLADGRIAATDGYRLIIVQPKIPLP